MCQSVSSAPRFMMIVITAIVFSLPGGPASAQGNADWMMPFPPHKVIGNVYYVGSKGLASYLVTTPQGHILINSSLESSVPLIRDSVEKLGFRFSDVKILLISHAHWDHNAGSARIKELTGAKYMVMEGDVSVVETGGETDFHYGARADTRYPRTKVDRVLHDGDKVTLGDTRLVANVTAGHTRGCTTWTMQVRENGKMHNVVIIGSPNVNSGYKLVNNTVYPSIAQDYKRTFRTLKSLTCDVFLGAHGNYYDMANKFSRLKEGASNPFIYPEGYKSYVVEREQAFLAELKKQGGSE